VFGLALLEIVELRLPAGLQRFAGGGSGQRRGGTLGVLGMGLAFVAAAFTCTAPFIGTVLVAAAAASSGAQWLRPVLGMAAFASALALPFFVLSLFPSLLSRLPRSGGWLTTVKGAMGFLEIAAALKFLSNADMVMGWNLLPRPLFLALWGIVGLAGALWLLGVLRLGYTTPEGRPTPARAAWAVAFAALGMYCLYGVTGRPLAGAVVAFLPPADYGLPAGATSGDHGGLTWVKSLDEGLARAKAENKPVLIDFTGYACTNCRWMENNIFPQPVVQSEMRNFVLVQLYTDGVDQASVDNQAYQLKTFDDVSLPLYAILSPDGTPGARSGGITRDPDVFARFLRTGREQELASRQRKGAETTTASAR
jgi:thiol:disulfide interchange protein DsbD